jgi:hypothetical protein
VTEIAKLYIYNFTGIANNFYLFNGFTITQIELMTILLMLILVFIILTTIFGFRKRNKKIIYFSFLSLFVFIAIVAKVAYSIKYTM